MDRGNNEIRGKTKILDLNENNDIKLENCLNGIMMVVQLIEAEGSDSEVILYPVRLYHNPFESIHKNSNNNCEKNYILCETYLKDGSPHPTN